MSLPGAAMAQQAGLPPKGLNGTLRSKSQLVWPVVINTATIAQASPGVVGTDGYLMSRVLTSITAISETSSIGRMPYPARLNFVLVDGNADDTLGCRIWAISGKAIDGDSISERVERAAGVANRTAITETVQQTSYVYSSVDRITISDCGSLGDSSDNLVVTVSPQVGIDLPVRVDADMLSICEMRPSLASVPRCIGPSGCTTRTLSGNVKTTFIDLTTCTFQGGTSGTFTPDDNDGIVLRYRGTPF